MKDEMLLDKLDKKLKENEGKTDQKSPKENLALKENQELVTKDNKIRNDIYIYIRY